MLPTIQPHNEIRNTSAVTQIDYTGESSVIDTSSTTFSDLNDDCVEGIFDHLLILDLCSITRTCSRFKGIGNRLFGRKCTHFNFPIVGEDPTLVQARKLFNSFGSTMLGLKINLSGYSQWFGTKIIDAIVRYCSTLKSLSLEWYKIPDNQNEITTMGLLFKDLQTLHLRAVYIEDLHYLERGAILTPKGNLIDFFTNCNSLIDLRVNGFERAIFESNLPKLEYFWYLCESDRVHTEEDYIARVYTEEDYIAWNVEDFFSRHKNLKSITLVNDDDNDIVCFLKFIAANCKILEKFHLTTYADPADYETSLKWLETLEHLKELEIIWMNQNVTKLLKTLPSKSLEVLQLHFMQCCSQLMPALSQIKTLRVLKLCGVCGFLDLNLLGELHQLTELFIDAVVLEDQHSKIDLIKMVKRLVNLKKFSFSPRPGKEVFTITKDLYLQLVDVVKNRTESKNRGLKIRCPSTKDFDHLLCQTVEFVDNW